MAINRRPGGPSPTQSEVHEKLIRDATGTKRLNVPVASDLYRRMKSQAADEDRSIAEITRELWVRYLDER